MLRSLVSRSWVRGALVAALLLALGTANASAVADWSAAPQSQAAPVLLGPSPYLCQHHSPFYLYIRSGQVFLENFEDGALNTPGVSASTGQLVGPGGLADSVDCDDGVLDGSGTNGRNWFSGSGSTGITFTFDAAALGGSLPNAAGIVWTDGAGTTRFEAFDAAGVSLGVIGPVSIADGSHSGGTAEDHFFGIVYEGGIKALHISNSSGGIEVDHLQFGFVDASQFPTTRRHLLLFNTGVADNEVPLAGGATDPHYRMVTSADPAAPGPNAIVASSIPDGFWMPNSLGSKWIAPAADQSMAAGNAAGIYEYDITFDLAGFNPATAVISGVWSSDDEGLDILINGSSRNFTVPLAGYGAFHSFTINSGFVPGLNTLAFRMQNGSGPTGLRVELFGSAQDANAAAGPTLTLLTPSSAPVFGSLTPDGHLLVEGAGFEPDAVVRWDGSDRSTTFLSSTQLRITPSSTDLRSTGEVQITVFNPIANALSNALPFRITPAPMAGIQVPFSADYSAFTLGNIRSLPSAYGGLTFKSGDPDTILIGGAANQNVAEAGIYAVGVLRDESGQIVGFTGPASRFADATNLDGGLAYGPDGVLFYARYPVNEVGQVKPGSSVTSKIVALGTLGVASSVGGLNFVPLGFPGSGSMKAVSWSGGQFYTVTLSPDGSGTFDLTGAVQETTVPGGPEGFVYVPPGSPQFLDGASMLVAEFSAGQIGVYDVDSGGNPIPASRMSFMTGLNGAEGSAIDPVTGDFLFSTFGGGDQVIVVRGFAVPVEGPGEADTGISIGAPTAEGDALAYSAQVGNAGPHPATNVRLVVSLTNFRFVGASASQGVCSVVGAQVECSLGTLGVGAAATVTVTLGPPLSGWAAQTFNASSDQSDPNLLDNSKTITLGENQPPVARAGDDRVVAGHLSQGALVTLDGRTSYDAEGQALTYRWTGPFPEGSGTVFGVAPEVTLPFGQSTVALVVHDGQQESAPSAVRITVSDFALSATAISAAVRAGEAATYSLTLAPQHGPFETAVTLACSGLPAGATCSFSDASITPGSAPATVTLTVHTSATLAAAPPRAPAAMLPAVWLGLAVLPGLVWMLPAAARRRRMALLAVLALAALHAACGGVTPPAPAVKPVATTTQFVITGASGGLTHNATASITITR